jgi:hypothetical protein
VRCKVSKVRTDTGQKNAAAVALGHSLGRIMWK